MSANKIALVYDRVNTPFGGAEEVLLALQRLYPQADLFTSVYDRKKAKWAKNFQVKTSFLQKIPFAKNFHRGLACLMPLAFESLDLGAYQLIISITSAEAKGVITRSDQVHLCYLLTPPRYLYHYQDEYLKKSSLLGWPIIKQLAQKSLAALRRWDQIAIHRPDKIIPISQVVAARIKKYYQLDCEDVIYPPVNVELFRQFSREKHLFHVKKQQETESYYLVVSRLVAYKNIDLAIKACVQLGKQLIIVGDGPQAKKLKALAAKLTNHQPHQIIWQEKLSPEKLSQLYQHAQALLMPGIDDFGITALEANLHGLPVLINQHSGASEVIVNFKHGLHLNLPEKIDEENEAVAIEEIKKQILLAKKTPFNAEILSKNALEYDTTSFTTQFDRLVKKELYDR